MVKLTEKEAYSFKSNGLILDHATKNPRKKKTIEANVGDEVRGLAVNFLRPIRGTIIKILDNTVIVDIENTYAIDHWRITEKNNRAVIRFEDIWKVTVKGLVKRGKRNGRH